MIDRLQNKIITLFHKFKSFILNSKIRIFESKWSVTFLIGFIILTSSIFIGNNIYEYYVKKNFVNIYQVKSNIVSFIRKNFLKAVQIGIADFSSIQGIIFEDIKISQEEDFSSSKLLFTSKRIDVRLPTIFAKKMEPEKIVIYSAKLTIDIDNPITNDILKYIYELNLPDIYFDNLEVLIRADNQEMLRTTRPIHISIKRKNQFLEIDFNDNRFLGLLKGSLKGNSKINLETSESFLRVDFSDHDLDDMSGISKLLLNLTPESGLADGFISFDKTLADFKIEGNLNFRKFSGDFFPISNIKANDFTINAKFSYLKEFLDKKTSESYFKRKISSPEFFYDEQIFTPVNNLKKTSVSIQVDNFRNLLDRLILEDEFSILGTMKLNMRIEETGKPNDWVWIDGNGSLSNLEFYSKSPEVRLTDTNLHFIWNQKELQSDIRGKLFGKEFFSDLGGVIAFNKPTSVSAPYVLASNLKLNVILDSIILKSFQSIYESISTKVSKDIKERQQKMLPESFFIQSFLYKVFLEKANLSANIKISDVKYRADSHSQGKYNLDLKVESGIAKLALTGGTISSNDNEFILNFYFDRKLPGLDFRTKISSMLWLDETFDLCDSSVYSDFIDFNMTFLSSGNNFSDLLVNRSIVGELSLRRNSVIRSNPGDTINLSELLMGQSNLDIKLGLTAYSQEGYLRNIEVKGSDGILRGNANLIRSDINFGLFGQLKNKPINLTFIKTGASCQKSKK